jgi:hypothetical protein
MLSGVVAPLGMVSIRGNPGCGTIMERGGGAKKRRLLKGAICISIMALSKKHVRSERALCGNDLE